MSKLNEVKQVLMALNEQRQTARSNDGRYHNMESCPRCGKRKALEPAYKADEGGTVKNDSKWAALQRIRGLKRIRAK